MSVKIIPLRLKIADFRCFHEAVVVKFPGRGELLGVVSGHNEVEPDLGANGTGKSTLWDALSWCLFGKTIRGLRGNHVIPWKSDRSPSVEFTFLRDGVKFRISRHAKPNIILIYEGDAVEGEESGQEKIHYLVGMDYSLFTTTVIQGQFSRSFLDYAPREKLDFLSSALGLDVWEKASEEAAKEMKQRFLRVQELDKEEVSAVVRLEEAQRVITTSSREMVVLTKRHRALAEEKARRVGEIEDLLGTLEDETKAAKKEVADSGSKVESLARDIGRLQRRKERAAARVASARARLRAHGETRAALLNEQEAIRSLEGVCPTCRSPITAKSIGRAIRAVSGEVQEAAEAEARAERRLKRMSRRVELVSDQWTKLGHAYGRAEDALNSSRRRLSSLRSKQASLSGELSALRVVAEDHSFGVLRNRVASAQSRSDELREHLRVVSENLERERRKASRVQFWTQGFKDMRLWIIRAALDELEAVANSHLLDLGLRGWRLNFDVERASASGSIIKGFTISVVSPKSPDSVPWEAWSGGEIQRLRVATQAAMIDLVRSRMGGGWLFEVWDEPTAHLSASGILDLTRFFRERARLLGHEVWLVDHRTLAGGEFTFEIRVTKTTNGSIVHQQRR